VRSSSVSSVSGHVLIEARLVVAVTKRLARSLPEQ
jgi:hypothetical protein